MTEPTYIYRAVCTRVIDGDTFIAQVDLGFYASIAIRVRIHGVNAPERRQAGGADATEFLAALIGGRPIVVQSYRDVRSFERWVCDVWTEHDENVAEAIITAGHGVATK